MGGIRLTIGQAVKAKKLGNTKSWPDIFIAARRGQFSGLFLELKREGTKLLKKNGEYATAHLQEQAELHEKLRSAGYSVDFVVGFSKAKAVIDEYLEL